MPYSASPISTTTCCASTAALSAPAFVERLINRSTAEVCARTRTKNFAAAGVEGFRRFCQYRIPPVVPWLTVLAARPVPQYGRQPHRPRYQQFLWAEAASTCSPPIAPGLEFRVYLIDCGQHWSCAPAPAAFRFALPDTLTLLRGGGRPGYPAAASSI